MKRSRMPKQWSERHQGPTCKETTFEKGHKIRKAILQITRAKITRFKARMPA
jgi:hypothetical protein